MRPEQLAKDCLDDIRRVREMHGDGPAGYVLTTDDGTLFLCQARDALLRLGRRLLVGISGPDSGCLRRLTRSTPITG